MTKPTLIIMAAGMGSRFGGLKQIEPVGPSGEVPMAYAVHDAIESGFGRMVFVIKPEMEAAFRERIGREVEKRADTVYVHQTLDRLPEGFAAPADREKPWGTGHAVLCCRTAVSGPFAVINADDFYGRASFRALADHLSRTEKNGRLPEWCMVGFELRNTLSPHGTVARGLCKVNEEGFLTEVVERLSVRPTDGGAQYEETGRRVEAPGDTVTSMNMWGFTPALFDREDLDRFREAIAKRVHRGEYPSPL